jgi:predicted MFS family arabinose efflux permease
VAELNMTAIEHPGERSKLSWFVFGLMASVTFVGILSELVPSGVLPQMSEGLGVSDSQVGFLVGVYALASAVCAIPLVSVTLAMNRKTLLMVLLVGFAASNIVVAFSSSYGLIVVFRIVGGVCAGVMWPMIAAYGARLVPEHLHGKAVTIIMAGNTLGISIGLPAMTTVGVRWGWRTEFLVLGLIVVLIAILAQFYLPSMEGEKLSKSNSPLAAMKNPALLMILLLTFLSVAAHYGIYTYIALLVQLLDLTGGVGLAMLIFGIGSVISVVVSAKFIDAHLRPLIVSMLALGGISMAMFLAFKGTIGVSHLAFFLWGLAFGPLVTMYQTAVIKRADEAKDVSTSVQSSVFNFSIMIATWVGGLLLGASPEFGVKRIVFMSLACFIAATIIAFLSRRALRSSDAAPAPH